MRISDWSSDVCSSDLAIGEPVGHIIEHQLARSGLDEQEGMVGVRGEIAEQHQLHPVGVDPRGAQHLHLEDREILAIALAARDRLFGGRSEEHTSELQSLMRISYAVFCLNTKKNNTPVHTT